MKFKELMEAARARPVAVECKEPVGDWESYAEAGMRMLVTGGAVTEDDVAKLELDFAPFEDFNRSHESSNYYGKDGKADRTAREAGYYKPQDRVYVDPNDDIAKFLVVLDGATKELLAEYDAVPTPRPSYVAWLEQQVTSLRSTQAAA